MPISENAVERTGDSWDAPEHNDQNMLVFLTNYLNQRE